LAIDGRARLWSNEKRLPSPAKGVMLPLCRVRLHEAVQDRTTRWSVGVRQGSG